VLVTVAVKVAWPPSTTDPFIGFTVTAIAGDGDGGSGEDAIPALQPNVHDPSGNSAMSKSIPFRDVFPLLGESDRMPSQKQAKGQRKEREYWLGIRE
jgi:hypothetical protein